MSTESLNLWVGVDEPVNLPKTPLHIFREQAANLSRTTKRRFVGDVSPISPTPTGTFAHVLKVVVPLLDNYSMTVAEARYPLTVYPAKLVDHLNKRSWDCANEEEFLANLSEVLGSERTKVVLAALHSQIRGAQATV